MKFVVDPIWSWPLVVTAIAALLALVLITYPPRIRHLAPRPRRLLMGLRLLAVLMLAGAMLRPAVEHRETDRKSAVLVVVADKSRSFGTQDGPGGVSRRRQMLDVLAEVDEQIEALAEEIEVRYYDFAEQLEPVEKLKNQTDGRQTAIGTMLDSLLREVKSDRVVGVVLMSDGAQRAVRGNDADPRQKARMLGRNRVPVYTIPFGGSGMAETTVDLAVEDLLVAPVVFEKKVVPVDAKIRAEGAAGRNLTVQLIVEDRTGKRPGEAGEMIVPQPDSASGTVSTVRIEPETDSELIPVQLSYVAERAGEYKVGIRVLQADGELKTANNRQVTIIKVRSGGIRVAYLDVIRPEQKWIKRVNVSENIQIDFQPFLRGRLRAGREVEPELFEPGKYDAYIIGDVPASVFDSGGENALDDLVERVNEGAGLMMLGGYDSFGAGGYAEHREFADLLPVKLSRFDRRRPGEIDPSLHYQQPLQMLPTGAGLRHFVMTIDSSGQNAERWRQLPRLQGANRLQPKEDGLVDVLAATDEDYPNAGLPLLFAHETGKARVMAFAGDTTYVWYLGGFEDVHQRFWRQAILWLTGNDEGDRDVWVRVEPRNLLPKQQARLTFGARSKQGRPISDAEFQVKVTDPQGKTYDLSPRRSGSDHLADFRETTPPGDYWVNVTAEFETLVDGQTRQANGQAWSRFIVDDRDLELDNPAADIDLMKDIATLTGGTLLQPEELGSLLRRKADEDLDTEVTKLSRTTLWDNWPFLLLFVSVMTAEWFFRKRRGLV